MKIIALIPARAGSKRIPGKNFKLLAGKPLIEYSINAAIESKIFFRIIINSDAEEAEQTAEDFGIEFFARQPQMATDLSPDIEWIKDSLETINYDCDFFVILRPTSPFRTAETIKRALLQFKNNYCYTSLKSMEPIGERPEKMWYMSGENGGHAIPYFPQADTQDIYTYEQPSSKFPKLFVQNGCIDICKPSTVKKWYSYIGFHVYPFFTEGLEGLDINTLEQWVYAEYLMKTRKENNANNL